MSLCVSCSVVRSFVPIDQVIATDFDVTTEWQEIRPAEPMESSHIRQMITLKVDGAKLPESVTDHAANTTRIDWNALAMPGGKLITPELQLVDENGTSHSLHGSQEGGNGRGYSVESVSSSDDRYRKYVALKIRSNIPFRAREIRWYTSDPK